MGFRNPIRRLSELVADRVIGALVATAETGRRIEMSAASDAIDFYSGSPNETGPGQVDPDLADAGTVSESASVRLRAPQYAGHVRGLFELRTFRNQDALINLVMNAANIALSESGLVVIKDTTGNNGVQIGKTGDPIRQGIKWGRVTQNTDASGDILISHQLGAVPTLIGFQPINPFFFHRVVDISIDGSSFKLRCMSTAGAVFGAGQQIIGFWWVAR